LVRAGDFVEGKSEAIWIAPVTSPRKWLCVRLYRPSFLLPLLFRKRLSDVFDDEIARLSEDYGDRDTALEITEGNISLSRFHLPPERDGRRSAGAKL
jgi:hypothetical protein